MYRVPCWETTGRRGWIASAVSEDCLSGSFCTLCVLRVGAEGPAGVCFWEFVTFGAGVGETLIINKGASSAVALAVVGSAASAIFHAFRAE